MSLSYSILVIPGRSTCTHVVRGFVNQVTLRSDHIKCMDVTCFTKPSYPSLSLQRTRHTRPAIPFSAFRMKLQPGILPFPVLRFWEKKHYDIAVPYYVTAIFCPLPGYRLPRKRKQKLFIYWLLFNVLTLRQLLVSTSTNRKLKSRLLHVKYPSYAGTCAGDYFCGNKLYYCDVAICDNVRETLELVRTTSHFEYYEALNNQHTSNMKTT